MRTEQRAQLGQFLGALRVRPLVMGILNVTPDSFSDGGQFFTSPSAIAKAQGLVRAGCDILDVGAESTRPGATPVHAAEELNRLETVLSELARVTEVPLSIDTYKAKVAKRAIELGAILINDVWGLQQDPAMADTVANAEAAVAIVHNRLEKDEALDVIADLRRFYDRSLRLAEAAGIPRCRIMLDPGVGFGKTSRQNREALARLAELRDYGLPILVGVSRKRFLGSLIGGGLEGTLIGTLAANLAAVAGGASMIRVHDVAEHVAALKVFQAVRSADAWVQARP
jgi:dihydropteroate synthase